MMADDHPNQSSATHKKGDDYSSPLVIMLEGIS